MSAFRSHACFCFCSLRCGAETSDLPIPFSSLPNQACLRPFFRDNNGLRGDSNSDNDVDAKDNASPGDDEAAAAAAAVGEGIEICKS